ncbi:MAG: hypothetical protein WD696_19280 [Bryobacteraceae bacterium]
MMIRARLLPVFAALAVIAPPVCLAQDRWSEFRSGPFEIFSGARERDARQAIGHFEQFRHALGYIVGKDEMTAEPPIRILLFRNAKDLPPGTKPGQMVKGRDRVVFLMIPSGETDRGVMRACARMLLDSSLERMPASIERGLVDLFATLEVEGTHITLGRPLPPEERSRDWALLHMLTVRPEYRGKARVMLGNLRNGVDEGPAYRNAFGKGPEEIERELDLYISAGAFETTPVSGRALNAQRDIPERRVEPEAAQLALGDLLLEPGSRQAYHDILEAPEFRARAHEGLGLMALQAGDTGAAREHLAQAIAAGEAGEDNPPGGRAYLEYARLETDDAKAVAALDVAVKRNPNFAEAHFLMARRLADPHRRLAHLRNAARIAARREDYWSALAEAYLAEKNFSEAAKAFRDAEQAATTKDSRARMREARLSIEAKRLDYEAAERRRKADEEERELRLLKEAAIAEIRELEAKANRGQSPASPGAEVVPWWDGPKASGRARGVLKQVECTRGQVRLVIEGDDKSVTRLVLRDPSQVAISGGGETTLGCGPQKGRRVTVEYFPKADPKARTAGDVASIEFQ